MTLIVHAAHCTARELDELLARRDLVIALGEGELRGPAAAAVMFAGWAILGGDAKLVLDTSAAWAGAAWRIGGRGYALWLAGMTSLDAKSALDAGLCDAIDDEPERWIGTRSELALDSAAMLIRQRGGDALERAEFARLFAAGEPQEGLSAFLQKRTARFYVGRVL
jgi:hypothetical protein